MLRTYLLQFAVVLQGSIYDIDPANVIQMIVLEQNLEAAKLKAINAINDLEPGDDQLVQFTNESREICENDIIVVPFEGFPA